MSRIHEALKKAEEEKANRAHSGPEVKAAEVAELPATTAEGMVPIVDEEPPAPGAVEAGSPDQLTLEELKSQVRKLHWNPNTKTMLFFGQGAYLPGTEEFRTLRSRLHGVRAMQPLRTILISSSSPREGKSFIAANLAQILVLQPDQRALLIDADLRWSRLHLSLGAPATPGLSDYLGGGINELSIIQRGPLENLYFIPGGTHPANPSELIANGRLKDLLGRLAPLFDWVIIDTPPAMAVSDARVMAELCDGVLLVVSAGMEPFDAVQRTKQQFENKHLLGVVLNRAEPRTSYSYKYYGYYRGPEKDAPKDGNRKGKG